MSSRTGSGTRLLATLGQADGKGVVHLEDHYDTDVDDLWSALTQPDRLGRWLGEFEGDLRVGGEFRARFFASGWEGTGRVEACDPPHSLRVVTLGTDETDEQTTEATLAPAGDRTLLVVEQRGMPVEHLAGYGAGNQIHLEDLAAHLAGGPRVQAAARWAELQPYYEQRLAGGRSQA
jgi:uncharacterized protein YndB with AHSA1/START domain